MLNYILPPIIIVISAALLIVFLFRKVDQIPEQEFVSKEKPEQEKKRMSAIMSALGQFGLKILERIMQRLKLVSLKFHNVSNDWFHSIREKRERRLRLEHEMKESIASLENGNTSEKNISEKSEMQKKQMQQRRNASLIREAVVSGEEIVKEKNKLEDVLIKRIAINPKDIEAYERLGDYYLECQNFQDSLECFRQVLRLSPIHYKARLRIRRIEKLIK